MPTAPRVQWSAVTLPGLSGVGEEVGAAETTDDARTAVGLGPDDVPEFGGSKASGQTYLAESGTALHVGPRDEYGGVEWVYSAGDADSGFQPYHVLRDRQLGFEFFRLQTTGSSESPLATIGFAVLGDGYNTPAVNLRRAMSGLAVNGVPVVGRLNGLVAGVSGAHNYVSAPTGGQIVTIFGYAQGFGAERAGQSFAAGELGLWAFTTGAGAANRMAARVLHDYPTADNATRLGRVRVQADNAGLWQDGLTVEAGAGGATVRQDGRAVLAPAELTVSAGGTLAVPAAPVVYLTTSGGPKTVSGFSGLAAHQTVTLVNRGPDQVEFTASGTLKTADGGSLTVGPDGCCTILNDTTAGAVRVF